MELTITRNKGFHVKMDNGLTVSVQIGGGNYAGNYDFPIGDERTRALPASSTAEIAVWTASGDWFDMPSGDTVAGWVPISDVFDLIQKLRAVPAPGEGAEAILSEIAQ